MKVTLLPFFGNAHMEDGKPVALKGGTENNDEGDCGCLCDAA